MILLYLKTVSIGRWSQNCIQNKDKKYTSCTYKLLFRGGLKIAWDDIQNLNNNINIIILKIFIPHGNISEPDIPNTGIK